MLEVDINFEKSDLRTKLQGYLQDFSDVSRAFLFAQKAHEGQFRKDGSPFFMHVLAVATLLSEIKADKPTIIAALLHDVVEDTTVTIENVKDNFGEEVAMLVEGVTKFSSSNFKEFRALDVKIESLRKWLEVVQKDVRVAVMKIADRLHNMQTLGGHSNEEKQRKIAKETIDVHVKIADRLGLRLWRRQLEDLSLKYFDRDNFETLSVISEEHVSAGDRIMNDLKKKLDEYQIAYTNKTFLHDPYTLFDLYLEDIHISNDLIDVLPHRYYLVMPNEADCYQVFCYLHKFGHREKGSFQDYINTSAINGYQALHTTIVLKDGTQVKFKVLTEEMYLNSQFGIARYCFSEDRNNHVVTPWLRRIKQVTSENKERSLLFWEGLQNDILEHSIAVYGPKDKLLLLPKTCTVLDAAFFFLGDDAKFLQRAVVNGRETFLSRRLVDGDHMDFILSSVLKVSHEWLDLIDTKFALAGVKRGLNGVDIVTQVSLGRDLLQREFHEQGAGLLEEVSAKLMQDLYQKYSLTDENDLYRSIASGVISEKDVYESLIVGDLQTAVILPRKVAIVRGELAALSLFLAAVPEEVSKFMLYKLQRGKNEAILKCFFKKVPVKVWMDFKRLLKRTAGVFLVKEYDAFKKRNQFLFLAVSTVIWVAEPIFIKSILETSLTPFSIMAIRFWSVMAFLSVVVGLTSLKNKKKILTALPLWQKDIFFLSLVLLTMAFATYNGLKESLPSNYLFSSSFYPLIMLVYLLVSLKKAPMVKTMGLLGLMIVSYILVFGLNGDNGWSIESRLWILLAGLAFGVYSFVGDLIQKKLKVLLRYNRLHLLLSVYCSVMMLALGMFVGWPDLELKEYGLAITLGVVFTGLPHLIFFYFLKGNPNIENTAIQLIGTVMVAVFLEVIVESIIYGVVPGPWKLGGLVLGIGSMFLLWQLYRKGSAQE